MTIDPKAVATMAQDYTAAWNSKSADAEASFYAADGEIVINRGEPWKSRSGIAEMAAGFTRTCLAFRSSATRYAARDRMPSISGP